MALTRKELLMAIGVGIVIAVVFIYATSPHPVETSTVEITPVPTPEPVYIATPEPTIEPSHSFFPNPDIYELLGIPPWAFAVTMCIMALIVCGIFGLELSGTMLFTAPMIVIFHAVGLIDTTLFVVMIMGLLVLWLFKTTIEGFRGCD